MIEILWRFWWVIAAAAILTGAVIYAGSSLRDVPALVRVVGSIAWLVGAAGLFAKGTGTVLGQGLTRAEGWLWQTELDGSVALAATCLPPGCEKVPGWRCLDGAAGPRREPHYAAAPRSATA
jgi:hypothetical protein